jgi:type I restriction enzyme, S subunit
MPPRVFQVKSGWLTDQASRLDAAAFGEGGLAARDHIKVGPWPWRPLRELARLFNGPRFARHYVHARHLGVPFLSSTDMLLADPTWTPLLSKARIPFLAKLTIEHGWTLISCSGTIGNTAYVREEIGGWTASQHVIRAAPHPSYVLPGYLFAFLTSASAQAMILQHTYGSVVQHIEPHHLADLPVPLPDAPTQRRIHDLVEAAASKRTEASGLLDEASAYFDAQAGPFKYPHEHALAVGLLQRSTLRATRLDAFTHVGWAADAPVRGEPLGSIAEVRIPGRLRLIPAEQGTQFVTGVDVYQLRPTGTKRIASWLPDLDELVLTAGQVLLQVDGQRYGLLGRPAFVGGRLAGKAASWHLGRISCGNPGRVFAFARSQIGRRAIVGTSYGTSVPAISEKWLRQVHVPSLPADLSDNANRALRLREEADAAEERAIQEVEAWLS